MTGNSSPALDLRDSLRGSKRRFSNVRKNQCLGSRSWIGHLDLDITIQVLAPSAISIQPSQGLVVVREVATFIRSPSSHFKTNALPELSTFCMKTIFPSLDAGGRVMLIGAWIASTKIVKSEIAIV